MINQMNHKATKRQLDLYDGLDFRTYMMNNLSYQNTFTDTTIENSSKNLKKEVIDHLDHYKDDSIHTFFTNDKWEDYHRLMSNRPNTKNKPIVSTDAYKKVASEINILKSIVKQRNLEEKYNNTEDDQYLFELYTLMKAREDMLKL